MPPLTGFAVKVTEAPVQTIFPGLAVIVTEGVTTGFTVMLILLLFAVGVSVQFALLVMVTVIISPFSKLLSV